MNERSSILDIYRDDIEKYLKLGASLRGAWKSIQNKLPDGINISYAGFYRYCKRKNLLDAQKESNDYGNNN